MTETCMWCFEKVELDEDGNISYHDFPKPCRAVCRGAKWPSIEATAKKDIYFQHLVSVYLQEEHEPVGVISVAKRNALCARFDLHKKWPEGWTKGHTSPHPILREAVVRWICEQNRQMGVFHTLGCPYDHDGDGNCHIHPYGCP